MTVLILTSAHATQPVHKQHKVQCRYSIRKVTRSFHLSQGQCSLHMTKWRKILHILNFDGLHFLNTQLSSMHSPDKTFFYGSLKLLKMKHFVNTLKLCIIEEVMFSLQLGKQIILSPSQMCLLNSSTSYHINTTQVILNSGPW